MVNKDELFQGVREYLVGLPRPAKRLLMIVGDLFFISVALAFSMIIASGPGVQMASIPWVVVPQVLLLLRSRANLVLSRLSGGWYY